MPAAAGTVTSATASVASSGQSSAAGVPSASSSRPAAAPGGHPAPQPGARRHSLGGRVRVDRSESSGGEEGRDNRLFVYIPDEPPGQE